MDRTIVVERTRGWIERIVVGLNLCPFARRVFEGNLIRYVVTDVDDAVDLLEVLADELRILATTPITTVETTLLIHPQALSDFNRYNDFVGDAQRLLAQLRLVGTVQLAEFHPQYRFAGTEPGDLQNHTNRSPYPMLHLLREASISAIAASAEELADIPRRNIETLRRLGAEKLQSKMREATGP